MTPSYQGPASLVPLLAPLQRWAVGGWQARVENGPGLDSALSEGRPDLGSYRFEHPASLSIHLGTAEGREAAAARAIYALALKERGLLVHAAAVVWRERAVVAAGESGAGKSTFSSLAADMPLLSDETVGIFEDDRGYVAGGTPFRSSCERPIHPATFSVGALVLLRKGLGCRLRPVARSVALSVLVHEAYRLDRSPSGAVALFQKATGLVSSVPCFELEFSLSSPVGEAFAQLPW